MFIAHKNFLAAPETFAPYNNSLGALDKLPHINPRLVQGMDIWSLGCVYSEAAVWIARGFEGQHGLQSYRLARKFETDKIPEMQSSNCFHDGRKILSAVGDYHEILPKNLPTYDLVTRAVLNTMIPQMLDRTGSRRPTAKELWVTAQNIIVNAKIALHDLNQTTHIGNNISPKLAQEPTLSVQFLEKLQEPIEQIENQTPNFARWLRSEGTELHGDERGPTKPVSQSSGRGNYINIEADSSNPTSSSMSIPPTQADPQQIIASSDQKVTGNPYPPLSISEAKRWREERKKSGLFARKQVPENDFPLLKNLKGKDHVCLHINVLSCKY